MPDTPAPSLPGDPDTFAASPRPDCARFLDGTKKRRFREVPVTHSCLSFAGWSPDDPDFLYLRRIILRQISLYPSAFISTESHFLTRGGDPDEAHQFLAAAGFDAVTISLLLPEGWSSLLR